MMASAATSTYCASTYSVAEGDAADGGDQSNVTRDAAESESLCKDGSPSVVGTPALCNGDFGTNVSSPCAARQRGVCAPDGTCTSCLRDSDCTRAPIHPGDTCSRTQHLCGSACLSVDAGCPDDTYCDFVPSQYGACVAKFANGEVIEAFSLDPSLPSCTEQGARYCLSGVGYGDVTTGCICGAPAGATCTKDGECVGDVCGTDGRCGSALGAACTGNTSCRSGRCSESCRCVPSCSDDSDCGNARSGRVCSTDPSAAACIDGCRGMNGNDCPYGQSCTSTGPDIGTCTASDH